MYVGCQEQQGENKAHEQQNSCCSEATRVAAGAGHGDGHDNITPTTFIHTYIHIHICVYIDAIFACAHCVHL